MYTLKLEEFNGIYEQKKSEMEFPAETINTKINEWKDKWLKEPGNGAYRFGAGS